MISIGEWLYGLFGSEGGPALVLCIFLIFLFDALFFPVLPELFYVSAFFYDPSLPFGLCLLAAAIAAETFGLVALYLIVGKIRVPRRIDAAINKYIKFLILGDERLLLLNRIAPMIPFSGAFVRIVGWDIKKSAFYVLVGCVLKYGAVLLMSDFFHSYYSGGDAQTFTLIFIFAVIAVSFALSVITKKKRGMDQKS
ncbi:MAG: hypothetical protein LBG63_04830 [Candidatus Methanoplasma sp.]|jgi:hypothetical protein|nr:hypothetical protein [Candidatus Methanoplasma sp.]